MGERLYSDYASDRAKDLLTHYFRLLFNASGLKWDSDNQVEIDQVVDEIIQAVKDSKK
jgi:hypothetical protein